MKKLKTITLKSLIKKLRISPKTNWITTIYWLENSISIVKYKKFNEMFIIDDFHHTDLDTTKNSIQNFTTTIKKTASKFWKDSKIILSLPHNQTTIQTIAFPKLSIINRYSSLERQLNHTKEFVWDYHPLEKLEKNTRYLIYKTKKETINNLTSITDSKSIELRCITSNARKFIASLKYNLLKPLDYHYLIIEFENSILKISAFFKTSLLLFRQIPHTSHVIDNELISICHQEINAIETYLNSKEQQKKIKEIIIIGKDQKSIQKKLETIIKKPITTHHIKIHVKTTELQKKLWQKQSAFFYPALSLGLDAIEKKSINLLTETYKNRKTEYITKLITLTCCPIIIGISFLLNTFFSIQETTLNVKYNSQHKIFNQQYNDFKKEKEDIKQELKQIQNILFIKENVISSTHTSKLLFSFSQLSIKELYINQIHISNLLLDIDGIVLTKHKTIALPKLLNMLKQLPYLYEINFTLNENKKPLSSFKIKAKFKGFNKK